MNAPVDPKFDDIRTFLPDIFDVEYEKRAKMRSYRNAASKLLGSAHCDLSRHLAWATIEWASPTLYNPAPLEWLDQVNQLCKRLLITAMQAEDMAVMLEGASHD